MGDLIPGRPDTRRSPAIEPVIAGLRKCRHPRPLRPRLPTRDRRIRTACDESICVQGSLHLRTARHALVNWWRAVTIQGFAVALLC